MADTPIAETSGAALAGGSHETKIDRGVRSKLSAEQIKRHEYVAELRREENKTHDPMAAFREVAKRNEFGQSKQEAIVAAFGGGEASINPATGKAELPTSASPEAKVNFDKAQELKEKYGKVIDYTQILNEAARSGKNARDIYTGDKYKLSEGQWLILRDNALDTLIKNGRIEDNFSNELAGLSVDQKRDYIEEVLAKDPALSEALAEHMGKIQQGAEKLKPAAQSSEKKKLDDEKTETNEAIQKTFDLIFDTAKIDPSDRAELQKFLNDRMIAGATAPTIKNEIFLKAQELRGLPGDLIVKHQQELTKYVALDKLLPDLKSQIDDLRDKIMTTRNADARKNFEKQAAAKQKEYDQGNLEYSNAAGIINVIQASTGHDAAWFAQNTINFTRLDQSINGGAPQPDGTRPGGIADYTAMLIKQHEDLKDLNRRLKDLPSADDSEKEKTARLTTETELLNKLEDVLPQAVAEVLIKRHDELKTLAKARLQKQIDEAQKSGDKYKVDALKAFQAAGNTRWIDTTGKDTITHRDIIRTDIQGLAINGDETAKRIFAEMTDRGDETTEKDKIATDLFSPAATSGARRVLTHYSSLTDTQKEQVNEVYKQQTDKFNELFTEQKANLETSITKNMFTARGLMEKLNLPGKGGDFLNANEWKMLQEKYGDMIQKGSLSHEDSKKIEEKLVKAGIHTSKAKWLLFALLGLFAASGKAAETTVKHA